ncbi:MAG: alpha/beta fold hydrolase [Opitutales bacterium]|nr:alpha/beta fold hydrolase [Opitutales bacterium]
MVNSITGNIPEELRKEYPFADHYLDLDGVRMHYVDEGEGIPILMLHGNPTWSFFYRNLIKTMSANRRCIAPDHIGCGLSDKPQQYQYTLDQHIRNVIRLVDSLGLKSLDLVVHDWGGAIGSGLATRRPDLVRRIVVMNTAGFLSKRIPARINICKLPGFGALAIRGFNAFAGAAVHMAVEKPLSPEIKKGFLLPYNNWKNRIATLRFVQDIPMSNRHPSHQTLQQIDDSLSVLKAKPMLICWGGKDWCFNDLFYQEWTNRFPKAETYYRAEANHYLMEDDGEHIIPKIREFLLRA